MRQPDFSYVMRGAVSITPIPAILAITMALGCTKPTSPGQLLKLPPGDYDLAPTNVVASPSQERSTTVRYSVVNLGTSAVPEKAYELDFYVDGQLVSFDHATSMILPGQTTDYQFRRTLAPASHTYSCVIRWLGSVP